MKPSRSTVKIAIIAATLLSFAACQKPLSVSNQASSSNSSSVSMKPGMLYVGGSLEQWDTALRPQKTLFTKFLSLLDPVGIVLAEVHEDLRDLNGNPIEIDQAYLLFEAVQYTQSPIQSQLDDQGNLKPKSIEKGNEAQLDVQGPFLVNLLEEAPEALSGILMPSSNVGAVHLRQARYNPTSDGVRYFPAGMEGYNLMIKGRLGNNRSFEFYTNQDYLSTHRLSLSHESNSEGVAAFRFEINLRSLMSQVIIQTDEALAQGACPLLAPGVRNVQSCLSLSSEHSSTFAY